jgi:hypothetical protein
LVNDNDRVLGFEEESISARAQELRLGGIGIDDGAPPETPLLRGWRHHVVTGMVTGTCGRPERSTDADGRDHGADLQKRITARMGEDLTGHALSELRSRAYRRAGSYGGLSEEERQFAEYAQFLRSQRLWDR